MVAGEGARIFDDYFRWYTGHRIYHQGFTRDGLGMGHWVGGDAMTGWVSIAWMVFHLCMADSQLCRLNWYPSS